MLSFPQLLCLFGLLNIVLGSAIEVVLPRDVEQPVRRAFEDRLRPLLSPNASISQSTAGAPRWSEYNAPNPKIVVNVATEQDVQVTVIINNTIEP